MKKVAKWVAGILLTPIILIILLTVALYIPPIQNLAVKTVAKIASEKMGMDIQVEHVCLVFPLDLGVDGVKVTQKNDSLPQVTDTIADIKRVVASVQLKPLFDNDIQIDRFDIYNMKVNTADFVHQARVKGTLDLLTLESHGIDLGKENVHLDKAYIEGGNIDVALADTVPEDTTKTENFWKITLKDLAVKNTGVTIHTPNDTMQVAAFIGEAKAQDGYFDLYKSLYKLAHFDLKDGKVNYDVNIDSSTGSEQAHGDGGSAAAHNPTIDLNGTRINTDHIALSGINIGVESLMFCAPDLKVHITKCQMKERCGIAIDSLAMAIQMDSTKLYVDGGLRTQYSKMYVNANIDLKAISDSSSTGSEQAPGDGDGDSDGDSAVGVVDAYVDASLGKKDIMLAMGSMPKAFQRRWPDHPLTVRLAARGNTKRVIIKSAYMKLPTAFLITAKGFANNPLNALSDKHAVAHRFNAKVHLDASTYNLDFIKALLDGSTQKMINIPALHAVADIDVKGHQYSSKFQVSSSKSHVSGDARFNMDDMSYTANVEARGLRIHDFVRGFGRGGFTGSASVKGKGTDVFSKKTRITAKASVRNFFYDKWNLNNMKLEALLSGGKAHASLVSHNSLIDGTIGIDALMSKNPLEATLTTELNKLDLFHLRIANAPLTIGACCHIDMATDKKEYYKAQGLISDLTIIDSAHVFRPDDMVLDLLTRRDTTHVVADCGDFHLNADTKGGYKILMGLSNRITKELDKQLEERVINANAFREMLPKGHIYLTAGRENPISRIIKHFDMDYSNVLMDFRFSPDDGINGEMALDTLIASGMQLDQIRLKLKSNATEMMYEASVVNGKDNPQYCFSAEAKGEILDHGLSSNLIINDDKGREGINVGLTAMMENEGIRLTFNDRDQILGYKAFSVNADNYILLEKDSRVSANITLEANDGMGLQLYTDDSNTDALQDMTVSLHKFNLKDIMSVIPYTPDVSGIMDGDFHVILTKDNMSVSSSIDFQKLIYEKCPVGNISTEFVYMPQEDGGHHIDGLLFKEGEQVGTIVGSYNAAKGDSIDATIELTDFPLDIANGFIPDQIIGLQGLGEGSVTVTGTLNKPDVNGEVFLQNASLISVPYGVTMDFDNDPVRIVGSKLLLENFQMYANNEQPLIIMGEVNFADLDHISVNMKMKAQNFKIIDAKENRKSEAYGQGYVNFSATMNGELSKLRMTGNLDVLPSTNLYYILKDSPITTDNRMKELVTFTDLSVDNTPEVVKPDVEGMYVNFNMNVMDGAHIVCWLNQNHTNYLDVIGGGTLKMKYRNGDISLTGKYTISSGEMKYSLPVIPLKTFKITEDSYIEFTGNMMNPRLSIEAKEENKATVKVDETDMTVIFNCGVKLSKTLQDMGLEFIIEAPENQTISDELKAKSVEERGKLAVTMLTTGMYLTEGNTSSFTMNSALSSFLQSEINNIAGSAFKTLDLSVGMDNTTDESGQKHTNYSFKFAKRFLNNRLSVSVGGKLSTGTYSSAGNQTFFDNVELQYRLSATSNQYLQAFYKRAVYDYLEGYLDQYGGGYIWRRKLQNFRDIFQFGDKNLKAINDSIQSE